LKPADPHTSYGEGGAYDHGQPYKNLRPTRRSPFTPYPSLQDSIREQISGIMDPSPSQPSDESKVLVMYTGGTIGMLVGNQGYVPEPYFLTDTLRRQSRFHDPLQESLFSNSASVQGYREWSSSSGKSTPSSSSSSASLPLHPSPTLPVRSSRPVGRRNSISNGDQDFGLHQPTWTRVSDGVFEAHVPSLVTPRSSIPGGGTKRIRYAILEVRYVSVDSKTAQ
jgi:hypothetical protein